MKKQLLALVILSVLLAVSSAQAAVIFEDDFENGIFDPFKWGIGSHNGSSMSRTNQGHSVSEANGFMRVSQGATDNGGMAFSTNIAVNSTDLITVTILARVHAGNSYVSSKFRLVNSDVTRELTYWGHYDYDYNDKHYHGFGQQQDSILAPGVWDTWFTEVITYDPATGATTYKVNDEDAIILNYSAAPLDDNALSLEISSYGWYTGHYADIDSVTVEQIPEPATIGMLGMGLAALICKRRKM